MSERVTRREVLAGAAAVAAAAAVPVATAAEPVALVSDMIPPSEAIRQLISMVVVKERYPQGLESALTRYLGRSPTEDEMTMAGGSRHGLTASA